MTSRRIQEHITYVTVILTVLAPMTSCRIQDCTNFNSCSLLKATKWTKKIKELYGQFIGNQYAKSRVRLSGKVDWQNGDMLFDVRTCFTFSSISVAPWGEERGSSSLTRAPKAAYSWPCDGSDVWFTTNLNHDWLLLSNMNFLSSTKQIILSAPNSFNRHFIFHRKCVSFEWYS